MTETYEPQGEMVITPGQADPVYVLTGSLDDPRQLDYDLMGLHKKRIFVKGELQTVEYYQQFTLQKGEYNGLAVRETNTYYRQQGFIFLRVKQIEWFKTDETVGLTKTTEKYYELHESMQEGFTRRNNLIYQSAEKILSKIGPDNMVDLITRFKNEIENYKTGAEALLLERISNDPADYLNLPMRTGETVREFLVDELTLVYE